MARFIMPIEREALNDFSGPASGYKLHFYESGTLSDKDTYSDEALTTANANPVVADSAGRFGDIFLGSGEYRVKLFTDQDVEVWDADPVEGTPGSSGSVDEKTGAYTVTTGDATKTLAVDATSGAVTITLLPAATAGDGFEITVKKTDASANAVTVDADGAELIDGAATYVLSLQYQSVRVRCDASGWHVVGGTRVRTAEIDADAVTEPKIAAQAVGSRVLDRSLFRGWIDGLVLSNNGTDADHDIDIAAGVAMAADQSAFLELAASLTKRIDAAWAVGTDQGGLDGSESVAGTPDADTWYHVWLIRRSDTGVVDALFSESATAPTMPTNYDQKRRIGAVLTDGSANIVAFLQVGDEFWWKTAVTDEDVTTQSTSEVTYTLGAVPTGVRVKANLTVALFDNTDAGAYVYPPDITNQSPIADISASGFPGNLFHRDATSSGGGNATNLYMLTNTSAQVKVDGGVAISRFKIVTHGWIDFRGRNA